MKVLDLIAGLISLASLFFKYASDGQNKRFVLAMDRIKRLEEMSDEEINKAHQAFADAASDPNVGRM